MLFLELDGDVEAHEVQQDAEGHEEVVAEHLAGTERACILMGRRLFLHGFGGPCGEALQLARKQAKVRSVEAEAGPLMDHRPEEGESEGRHIGAWERL